MENQAEIVKNGIKVPINIVVDAPYIVKRFAGIETSPKNPGKINFKSIYMVADGNHAVNGQGTDNLTVRATIGDQIEWRTTTIAKDQYSVLLYDLTVVSGPMLKPAPSITRHMEVTPEEPRDPNSAVNSEQKWELIWSCHPSAINVGRVTYNWKFRIVENKRPFKTVGWFYWDPVLIIERR